MVPLMRRTLVSALILSLISASVPADAANIAIRGNAAGASHPVVAINAGSLGTAPLSASLSLNPASLAGSLSAPQNAPRLAPSLPALPAAPAAANDAPKPGEQAAPVDPAAPQAKAAESAEAAHPSVLPAAEGDEASQPAPAQAAPAPRRTAMGLLKSILSRSLGAKAVPDFDGARERKSEADAVAAEARKSWVQRRLEKHAASRSLTRDEFGGPKPLGPTTSSQKVAYGLKWGVNMAGIVALYNLVLAPLIAAIPWPAFLSDAALEAFGRVALLTRMGPNELVQALSLAPGAFLGLPLIAAVAVALAAKPLSKALTARGPLAKHARPVKAVVYGAAAAFAMLAVLSAPGAFLGASLPWQVVMEEVSYRVLSFLPMFALLALTRPVLNWLADHLDAIPDHAGMRRGAQSVLRFLGGTVAWFAYPFAAAMASWSFASAHFAHWGVDPYVFIVQFTLGMLLTRIAYKTESLSAPITAHLTYNLLALAPLAMVGIGMPGLAVTVSLVTAILSGVYLLYNFLKHRRDMKEAKNGLFPGAKSLTVLLLAGLIGAGSLTNGNLGVSEARFHGSRPSAVLVQDAAERAGVPAQAAPEAPAPAAAQAQVRESRADVVARVTPSVFRVRVADGSGTGFILSREGLGVTNGHVVGATPVGGYVLVDVEGAPPLRARLLAVNHDRDIALLQLPRHPSGAWPALTVSVATPRAGEETIAIGFPLGLEKTVTHGIISGVGRHANMYVSHLQTDAPINPGNSGGPLFNERGEVIGINTLIVTRNGGSVGLGFSIMSADLVHTLQQYQATGDISSGRLGIIVNLSDPAAPEAGLAVEYVRPGSGAENAGLQRGDLILSIGTVRLTEKAGEEAATALAAALAQTVPGQKVPVVVLRGDQTVTVEVTIDAKASHPSH